MISLTSEMKKLILLVLIQNFVAGQIQVPSDDGIDLFNNMMRYLFDNCRSEFGTIGFWDTDRIFLADDEVDFVLLNDYELFGKSPTRRIKFLVAVVEKLNPRIPKISLFNAEPMVRIETMIIFDKGGYRPQIMLNVFQWYEKKFKNSRVYYCYEQNQEIVILTLNAFADIAPTIWITNLYIQINKIDALWSVFKTKYNKETQFNYEGFKLCKSMLFDRTEKLFGYKIKAAANFKKNSKTKLNNLLTKDTNQITYKIEKEVRLFSKVLTDYLNVSIEITHGIPNNNITRLLINLMKKGIIELYLTPAILQVREENYHLWNRLYLSYPFHFINDQIVTHNRGLATPLEKMFEFYGWLTIITTLIILLIVFLVIYLSNSGNNARVSFAVFECLRIMISNSMYTRMDTAKMRIFFSVIFLYFLIIQATFSGNLTAFLTKPVYRKNVETLEDLQDPRYTRIYANQRSRDYIKGTVIDKKTKFGGNCKKYIKDPSVACIHEQNTFLKLIRRYHLHTSKDFVQSTYAFMTMTPNWALRDRINNMIMRMSQSGLGDVRKKIAIKKTKKMLKKIKLAIKNYHRPIKLKDVMFAFVLLGIGLFSSIVCFIAEYLIKTCTFNKTKIFTSLIFKAKSFTILIVSFFILRFRRLL